MHRLLRTSPLHVALSLGLLGGCASGGIVDDSSEEGLRQEADGRTTAPVISSLQALGVGNRTFAFDLYHQLAKADASENLVFSPYSISSALALTYAGARGKTADELKSALHFGLAQETLHAAFGQAAAQLAERGRDRVGADGTPFRLNVSSAVWPQAGSALEPAFVDTARKYYAAEPVSLDFRGAPEASRVAINDRVAKDTQNLITNFLPPGSITSATRLVLTNTVYFNASWRTRFSESATREAPFTRPDGSTVDTKFMNKALGAPYARGEDYRAVALPYASADLSFIAVLPDEGKLAKVEAGLSRVWFDTLRANLRSENLEISLPKLDFRARASLPSALAALGAKVPFTDEADFTGLTSENLSISDVVHEAVIKVFEGGTIAAAATGVAAVTSALLPTVEKLTLDRAFLFAIVDEPTGQVLFLGRVTDPTAK